MATTEPYAKIILWEIVPSAVSPHPAPALTRVEMKITPSAVPSRGSAREDGGGDQTLMPSGIVFIPPEAALDTEGRALRRPFQWMIWARKALTALSKAG